VCVCVCACVCIYIVSPLEGEGQGLVPGTVSVPPVLSSGRAAAEGP